MSNESEKDQLKEIDDILAESDPDFLKGLSNIKADALDNQEIAQFTPDSKVKYNRVSIFWRGLEDLHKKILVIGGFLLLVAIPALLISWLGWFTPGYQPDEQTSLAMWADEVFDIEQTAPEKNLRDLFHTPEFLLDIPEQVFHLRPKRDIRFGRFSFYIQMATKKDLSDLQPRGDQIVETIAEVLRNIDVDDFQGVDGKEAVRNRILAALVKQFGARVVNVRYRLLVFN